AGNTYVTGSVAPFQFPTALGVFQLNSADQAQNLDPSGFFLGRSDAFVMKLDPAGAPIFSTYLSGRVEDQGNALAVDSMGNIYIVGTTRSGNFPIRSAFSPEIHSGFDYGGSQISSYADGFLTKLSADGSHLIYSTFLGGEYTDIPRGVFVDALGAVYVVGQTQSLAFPTLKALQPMHSQDFSDYDAFVTKFAPSGRSLEFSTYLGGNRSESAIDVLVDAAGSVVVVGDTRSEDLPTHHALLDHFHFNLDDYLNGLLGSDIFAAKLNPNGAAIDVFTYLGGDRHDEPFGLTSDAQG